MSPEDLEGTVLYIVCIIAFCLCVTSICSCEKQRYVERSKTGYWEASGPGWRAMGYGAFPDSISFKTDP